MVIGGIESHLAELFAKVDHFLTEPKLAEYLDSFDHPVRRQRGKSFARLLPNGSRLIGATTNAAARGPKADFILLDEAGLISDEVYDSVFPTLATTDGPVWAAGTPSGSTGWFYELWSLPQSVLWLRSEYKAAANPRIGKRFLDEMARRKRPEFMQQEFECVFLRDVNDEVAGESVHEIFVPKPGRRF
jgi:hypothetical protein